MECDVGRNRYDGNLRKVLLVEDDDMVSYGMCCWKKSV